MHIINTLNKMRNAALKVFGDIKVFKYPLFILYDPGSYLLKGEDMRQVINSIQPGDIIIRGYKNYLDGYFIPGFFSHVGLFLGPISQLDINNHADESTKSLIKVGDQMVIHSMAEGVFMEDVLNFCRCDYMAILRRKPAAEDLTIANLNWDEVKKIALSQLGKPYDFEFNFSDYNNLSCTEFVYVCYENIMHFYGIQPKKRTVMLITKEMIIPDDFINNKFQLVWSNAQMPKKQLEKLLNNN